MVSERHTWAWALQESSTAKQGCAARVAVEVEAGSLKAEDHPTLVSKRHTLALASQWRSTPNQSCPARVVGGAEAGSLASERQLHFGKRVARLGSGLAGCGLAGAGASVGSEFRPNPRMHPTRACGAPKQRRACMGRLFSSEGPVAWGGAGG